MTADDMPLESQLISRFRKGDEEAFRLLFDQNADVLRARILHLMPKAMMRRLSISDVLQEVQIIAYRRRQDLKDRGPGSFRKWLLGIVDLRMRGNLQRHANAAKRSVNREITKGCRPDTEQCVAKEPSPSQHAIGSEMEKIALKALAQLPEPYREVVRLTCLEHFDLEELAERIGKTREATRKLQGRALLKLAELFNRMKGGEYGQ